MKEKLKSLEGKVKEFIVNPKQWIKTHPIKTLARAGLAGLIGLSTLTCLKDNMHFVPVGTIEFTSP